MIGVSPLITCYIFFALLTSPIVTVIYCIGSCSDPRNLLYEDICCTKENLGSVVRLRSTVNGERQTYIFCPSTLSEYCNKPHASNSSCAKILGDNPLATSGYYDIKLVNGSTVSVYCDMDGANCDGQGGWTRIAHLNMSEPGATCPSGLTLRQFGGVGLCGRGTSGCQSTFYSTYNQTYSQVCGQIRGYQIGSIDGFWSGSDSIESHYVEGVSITHGNPRHHIWTYVGGENEDQFNADDCPCNIGGTASIYIPSFVGNDYYCESGRGAFTSDPLWDGEKCNDLEGPCCTNPKLPWFTKSLNGSITDDIELRLCADGDPGGEDTPLDLIELFIK